MKKGIICYFCKSNSATTYPHHAPIFEGAEGGPKFLIGKIFCSPSCRANAVLLAHIEMHRKHPESTMTSSTLLGMVD